MTSREFKNNLIEVIKNNSNLECEEDDTVLFSGIDSIMSTKEFEPKILVKTEDKIFIISIDAFSTS